MNQRFFAISAVLALLLIIYSGDVVAGKILYDDFSSAYIDGSKWQQRTFVREILNGKLVSKLGNRSPGMSAEVAPGIFRNNLQFANPNSINSIECEITIEETKLDSAPDSSSFARIAGYFYSKNETGGATGDIFAHLMIGDQGNGKLEAFWEVQEMLTDDTRTWNVIGSGTISDFDTSKVDPPYKVKISYDGDRTFSFIINELYTDSYIGPIRKRAEVTSWKGISTGINATNGSNNGYVFAKFDNVYINGQLTIYEDFSTSPLDHSKWKELEYAREISAGKLRMNDQGCDDRANSTSMMAVYDPRYIEAKLLIDSSSLIPFGRDNWVRMAGWYYNDSRGPGSGVEYNGYEGDIWVSNRLKKDFDGQLKAVAAVHRSDDAGANLWTTLLYQAFPTPINFDTEYVLSIEFVGSKIIYKCNNDILIYEITTPIYKPYGKWVTFQSRVYLTPGECGYIKGQIDDVFVYEVVKGNPGMPLLLLND